jgi:carotenoid cleavage dioxygenase-like enzyme
LLITPASHSDATELHIDPLTIASISSRQPLKLPRRAILSAVSCREQIEGELPEEIRGTFLQNGPGIFSVDGATVTNPIDGDGIVRLGVGLRVWGLGLRV